MLIPNQDTILALAAVAAKNPEATVLVGINGALENLRAVDKKLREKLLVLRKDGQPQRSFSADSMVNMSTPMSPKF